jgi:hypothetical protein
LGNCRCVSNADLDQFLFVVDDDRRPAHRGIEQYVRVGHGLEGRVVPPVCELLNAVESSILSIVSGPVGKAIYGRSLSLTACQSQSHGNQ